MIKMPKPKFGWHGDTTAEPASNDTLTHWTGEIPRRDYVRKMRTMGVRNLSTIVHMFKPDPSRVPDEHVSW